MFSSTMVIVCLVLMSCSLVSALYMFYGMHKNNAVKVLGGLGTTMGIWMLLYVIINIMAILQKHGQL